MEAPNKLFIKPEQIKVEMIPGGALPNVGIQYIRKDALLEWAKEKHNEYKQMDEDFQGDVFIGNRHAFAEVIAKIESL